MLYRTQHHSFFSPFTFSSSSLSLHNPSSSSSSSLLPLLLSSSVQGMECVEGALKSSCIPETKVTQNEEDDLWAAGETGQNVVITGAGTGDDFFVDDLLDFSNGFVENEGEEEDNSVLKSTSPVSVEEEADKDKIVISLPVVKEEFGSLPPNEELTVPGDDLDSLEWLSHFVEDSFSGYSLTGKLPVKPEENGENPVQEKSCFTTPVQTKARTKRGRTSVRVWPSRSGSLTESSTTSSSSCSSTTTMSYSGYLNPVHATTAESPGKPPVIKKQKKKPTVHGTGGQQVRRCSHCGVQKTPQWRAGPMGAKTLCNACGVRFKSGRLLPEYRPACSPTFSSELHSNNHRKVLEMRRKKEVEDSGLAQPVQSF